MTAPSTNEGNYAVGMWGDLPYCAVHVASGVPNLIADMNASNLAFSVHVGDPKAGSGSACDEALYQQSCRFFDSLEAPAMFTPGDNDWTDCDRPSNGGYNSRERLDRERAVFFGKARPLAITTLTGSEFWSNREPAKYSASSR